MRLLKIIYGLAGLALLGLILHETDLEQVWWYTRQIGGVGIGAVLAVYFLAFLVDTASWQLMLKSARLDCRWLYRLWKVRMVGEAFNNVTPLGTIGGEPVKAALLKTHFDIGYREGAASLVLAKTTNLVGLVVFLAAGFGLTLLHPDLPRTSKFAAGIGLAIFATSIAGLFLAQRFRITSRAGSWIGGSRIGRRIGDWLHHIAEFEDRLIDFYGSPKFGAALLLAMVNWVLGVVEIYLAMFFLGHPVDFAEAWLIESFAQLIRVATFFIPLSIGAQEGAFLLVVATLTGDGALGIAVALVRRFRDLVWVAWGLTLGWLFSLDRRPRGADAGQP